MSGRLNTEESSEKNPTGTNSNSPSKSLLEQIVTKFELLDIPRSELAEIRFLVESKKLTTFKDLILHIMKKFNNILPEHIARTIGGHMNPDDPKTINWDVFLRIMEEEVSLKDKMYNQMNFGSNKIFMQKREETNLSHPPQHFFYKDYEINHFRIITDFSGTNHFCLFIINNTSMAITSLDLKELVSRNYFERDFKGKLKEVIRKKNEKAEELLKEANNKRIKLNQMSSEDSHEGIADFNVNANFDIMKFSGLEEKARQSIFLSENNSTARRYTVDTRGTSHHGDSHSHSRHIRVAAKGERGDRTSVLRPSVKSTNKNSKHSIHSKSHERSTLGKKDAPRQVSPPSRRSNKKNANGDDSVSSRKSHSVHGKTNTVQTMKIISNSPQNHVDSMKSMELTAENIIQTSTHSKRNSILMKELGITGHGNEFLLPSSQMRMSTLGIKGHDKNALDQLRLDTIIMKSKQVKEAEPDARRKMLKLFTAFRSLVAEPGAGLPEVNSIKNNVGYMEGDEYFDEVDFRAVNSKDIMREYNKRLAIEKVNTQIKDFNKHAKVFKRNLHKIEYHLNYSLEEPENNENIIQSGSSIHNKSVSYSHNRSRGGSTILSKKTQSQRKKIEDEGIVSINFNDPMRLHHYKNWYDKPKSLNDVLTCVNVYFWKQKSLLVISFLTRELNAYSLDYKQEYYMKKMEELVLDDFCNQFCTMQSEYKAEHSFILMQINYNKVEVYGYQTDMNRVDILAKTLKRQNLVFSVELSFNPKIRLLRTGFVAIGEDKIVKIFKQTNIQEFQMAAQAALYQKYTAITVTCMDYSARQGLLLVGSQQGAVYLLDCEVNKIVFKHQKYHEPVLDCYLCDILRCFFVFWTDGRFAFFDLINYSTVQEFNLYEWADSSVVNRTCTWSHFPEIDEEMEAISRRKDFYDEETRNKLAKILEDRFLSGKYYVYFGNSTFSKFSMNVDRDLQFREIVAKIKMMERKGLNIGNDALFGHEISKIIIDPNPVWKYISIVEGDQSILLVTDKKLMVYFNYVEGLIIRYSLLQMEGDIIRLELLKDRKQLFVANSLGRAVVFNLVHMHPLKEFEPPLEKVIHAEPIFTDSFDVAYFQMPGEIYVLMAGSKTKQHIVPALDNQKEVMASQTNSSFLLILQDANYIYCLLEDFKIELISKKSLRLAKEIDLFDSVAAKILKFKTPAGIEAHRDIIYGFINHGAMFLQLSGGYIVLVYIDPTAINDYKVYYQHLDFDDFRMDASDDNHILYVFLSARIESYSLLPFLPEYSRYFPSSIYSPLKYKANKESRLNFKEELQKKIEEIDHRFKDREFEEIDDLVFEASSLNPFLKLANKDFLPERFQLHTVAEIKIIKEKNYLYLHPFSGDLNFYDLNRKSLKTTMSIPSMIKNNKTFDQKRLNETNMMNVRNIIRGETTKTKTKK